MVIMRGRDCMRYGLVDLVNWLPGTDIEMVEVGSFAGESADIFA